MYNNNFFGGILFVFEPNFLLKRITISDEVRNLVSAICRIGMKIFHRHFTRLSSIVRSAFQGSWSNKQSMLLCTPPAASYSRVCFVLSLV